MAANLFIPYFVNFKTQKGECSTVGFLVDLTDKHLTLVTAIEKQKDGRRGFAKPLKLSRADIIEHYALKTATSIRRVGAVDAVVVDADTAPIR